MSAGVRPPCDEAVIAAGPSPPAGTLATRGRTGSWVLAAAVLGSSLAFIDGTVVNVALPSLQTDLKTDSAGAQWVVEAYSLFLAALLLVGGSLGDRYGRRRIFAIGVAMFAVSSAVCGAAPSIGVLVAARAVQGASGALLTPGSLALISATFPRERRGRAIGTWSGATGITSALGPLVGGLLVQQLSWRWAFLVNLPIAAAVLVITARHVPESRDEDVHGRLDVAGALLVTVGLGGVVLALIRSQTAGVGDPLVMVAAVVGVGFLAVFIAVERVVAAPMLSLGLFRSRAFATTNALTLLLYAGLGGALFFVPLCLIEVHGYSPVAAGAALLPFVAILSVLSRLSGGLVDRMGPRPPLVVGPLVAAAGFALMAVPGTSGGYWTTFFPAVAVLGLGMALVVAPLTTTVMGSVATSHAGAASGVNNAVSRTAGLLAIAIFGVVLSGSFTRTLDSRLDGLALTPSQRTAVDAQRPRLALAQGSSDLSPATASAVHDAVDTAFVSGFRSVTLLAAGLAAGSALVAAVGLPSASRRWAPGRRSAA